MMKLVMGLGNPGSEYQNHRHNVGYMILDKVAKKLNVELDIKKKKTVFGKAKYGKIEYLLLKPQTFMNLSGEAALYMASFMKIAVDDIIVIYDDMNIPVGEFKLVIAKNDANDNEEKEGPIKHNGIKSIEESLKSNNFTRVGIGIGVPAEGQEIADFVLSPFTKDERKKIKDITDDVVDAICKVLFESNNKTSKKKYLEYKNHRHNIGFIIIDKLAQNLSLKFDNNKKKSLFTRAKLNNTDFILLKPQTFMNLSGESAIYISKFFNIKPEDIIVIYDDMDIPFGTFKIKKGGSSGGHNGIKSLIAQLQTDDFIRLRVGIGRPSFGKKVNDYVLSSFSKSERENIDNDLGENVIEAIKTILFESYTIAQNKYNKRINNKDTNND